MEAVYQIPLLLMEAVLNPIVLPLSLQYSWVYYVGILSAMVFLIKEKWHAESIFLLFLITGMVTSYVDLLTYPRNCCILWETACFGELVMLLCGDRNGF